MCPLSWAIWIFRYFCSSPQGTKLGPLPFLIIFNRILAKVREYFKFADDLTVLSMQLSPPTTEESDLTRIFTDLRAELGRVKLTISKTKSSYMTFSFIKIDNHSSISLLLIKKTIKILGVLLDVDLRWSSRVDYLTKKGTSVLTSFTNLKRFGMPTKVLKSVYCSYVRSSLEYACQAWHPGLPKDQSDKLEMI